MRYIKLTAAALLTILAAGLVIGSLSMSTLILGAIPCAWLAYKLVMSVETIEGIIK